MKKNIKAITSLFAVFFLSYNLFAEPNVLKCKKNCGTSDLNNEFTFQARLSMGPDKFGGNVSFIENLSLIHISEPRDVEESRMPSSA